MSCPPYYKANQTVAGIERGTEWVEVLEAFTGREVVETYMQAELLTKAMRLFTRPDTRSADLQKARAAIDVLIRLDEREE